MSLGSYLTRIFNEPDYYPTDVRSPSVARPVPNKPKPTLAHVRQAPTKEDFDAWRDNPVTQFVFAAHRQIAKECREAWDVEGWEKGNANQKLLDELRVRADTYNALPDTPYDGYCDTLGLEPRTED